MLPFRRNRSEADSYIAFSRPMLVRFWGMFFVMLLVFLGLVKALQTVAPALVLVGAAVFLALALNAPVQWIAQRLPGKRRDNRALATSISVLLILVALGAFLSSIIPAFAHQIHGLAQTVPSFVSDLHSGNSEIGKFIDHYNLQGQVDAFTSELQSRLGHFSGSVFSVLGGLASSTFSVLTIVVLTFMMLVEGPRWVRIFEQLVPEGSREHSRELSRAMYKVIKGYVNGQVALAAIAAVLILPGLLILHISYPIALMVIIFICGLIPMVGHLIGATIVTLVALFTSPTAAVVILAYYFLYQQTENYLIQPKIQSNSTNMSPLLVFIAVLLGINFGGLLGGLVAIPVMGCIRILVLDQLTRRRILTTPSAEATVRRAEGVPVRRHAKPEPESKPRPA